MKTLTNLLLLPALILMTQMTMAQDEIPTFESIRIVDPVKYETTIKLPSEYLYFNYFMKLNGNNDLIDIREEDGVKTFWYKGSQLPKWQYAQGIKTDQLIVNSFKDQNDSRYFTAIIINKDKTETRLRYEPTNQHDRCVIFKSNDGDQSIGQYREYDCNGTLIIEGQYCKMKGMSIDTIQITDPETYETKTVVTERHSRSKKCGVWKTYHPDGKLMKEESTD